MSRGCQEGVKSCQESAKQALSTCQEGVKWVSREWQMDVNRESKYVKRMSKICQEL